MNALNSACRAICASLGAASQMEELVHIPDYSFPALARALDTHLDESMRAMRAAVRSSREFGASLPAAKAAMDTAFYVTFVELETKCLLRQVFQEPERRFVYERYLALLISEALTATPKLSAQLVAALKDATQRESVQMASAGIDLAHVEGLRKEFGDAIRPLRRDGNLAQLLDTLRNNTTAHHLAAGRLDELMEWSLITGQTAARLEDLNAPERALIQAGTDLARALQVLGQGLLRGAPSNLPAKPKQP